jgi:hypothetical protein
MGKKNEGLIMIFHLFFELHKWKNHCKEQTRTPQLVNPLKGPIIAQSNKPSRHEANEQVSTPNLVKGLKMRIVVMRSIPNWIQPSILGSVVMWIVVMKSIPNWIQASILGSAIAVQ